MRKKRPSITILNIGDSADFDSYKKLNREKHFILNKGFDYRTMHYKDLLRWDFPDIKTEKVIIFNFFPFAYWNKHIEHKDYRGAYGNLVFYRKFNRFCNTIIDAINRNMADRDLCFINNPLFSAFYRDKKIVTDILSRNAVPVPSIIRTRSIREINSILEQGRKLYIKPRCGSMGKGITFLQLGDWQTNFKFKDKKIINLRSDHGWKFRDFTGNKSLLKNILSKKISIEEGIDSINIKGDKVDFRVYTFFDKVLYVYPRRNEMDAVTTNISQGGRGDPTLLDVMPERILSKIKRTAIKATKVMKLGFTGIDVVVDSSLKKVYIVDVNMFPGFPKRKTFNLSRCMISELRRLTRNGRLKFSRSDNIRF